MNVKKFVLIPHNVYIRDFQALGKTPRLTRPRPPDSPPAVLKPTFNDCGSQVYVDAVRHAQNEDHLLPPPAQEDRMLIETDDTLDPHPQKPDTPSIEKNDLSVGTGDVPAIPVKPKDLKQSESTKEPDREKSAEEKKTVVTKPEVGGHAKPKKPKLTTSQEGEETQTKPAKKATITRSGRRSEIKRDPGQIYWLTG